MEQFADRMDGIIEKVAEFKKIDTRFELFGSRKHQYLFNPVVSMKEVEEFESTYHIQLPADYRYFITTIGNGGAGPYYGLRRSQDFQAHYIHHDAAASASVVNKPFPAHYWLNEKETFISKEMILESVNGTISICEEGDGYNHLLIVAGPEASHVWYDASVSNQGMTPFSGIEKNRFSFMDWYESWLEMAEEHFDMR